MAGEGLRMGTVTVGGGGGTAGGGLGLHEAVYSYMSSPASSCRPRSWIRFQWSHSYSQLGSDAQDKENGSRVVAMPHDCQAQRSFPSHGAALLLHCWSRHTKLTLVEMGGSARNTWRRAWAGHWCGWWRLNWTWRRAQHWHRRWHWHGCWRRTEDWGRGRRKGSARGWADWHRGRRKGRACGRARDRRRCWRYDWGWRRAQYWGGRRRKGRAGGWPDSWRGWRR